MTPTEAIAQQLGAVAACLERSGNSSEAVANFLLRCAFTSFASSAGLLPQHALSCAVSAGSLGQLWTAMVHVLGLDQAGELFVNMLPLPLDAEAKRLVIEADCLSWDTVDLSIFGSLVETSFDAKQRHRLGAHYTPRSYVYRVVRPTLEEPLREEWEIVQGLSRLSREGTAPHHTPEESLNGLIEFQKKLASTRVLDPACGTGNFLIVALETLYEIEDEVLAEFVARGAESPGERVSPHQCHGIEINPLAAGVCRLVLQLAHLRRRHQRD